jgi:FlaG/FlaF family flagellin (archaellin)
MSPLIATVLLMAFAVALGGMIMNWTAGASIGGGECNNIKVDVINFCSKEDSIYLNMRNSGDSVPLQGVKVNVLIANFENTLNIKNSQLAKGQPLQIDIPATTASNTRVDIIGVVGSEVNPFVCTKPLARAEPLTPC